MAVPPSWTVREGSIWKSARPAGVRPRGAGVAEFRPAAPHPALEQRPGVIEIDLPEGVGVRVGSFVNERALSRVLRVLKGRV